MAEDPGNMMLSLVLWESGRKMAKDLGNMILSLAFGTLRKDGRGSEK